MKVTAIVSTYNAENYIASRLRNLLMQPIYQRGEMEIVVIDSNSQEGEGAIVQNFQRNFDRIRYVRTPQRETVYKAWQRGVDMAKGEYVINANTDDLFVEPALSILAEHLDHHPEIAAAYGDWFMNTDAYQSTVDKSLPLVQYDVYCPLNFFYYQVTSHAALIRKEVVQQLGGYNPDFTVLGDRELMMRFAGAGYQAERLDVVMGQYFMNESGLEHGSSLETKNDEFQNILDDYVKPGHFLGLLGIASQENMLSDEVLADLYTLSAALGLWESKRNTFNFGKMQLEELLRCARDRVDNHWLANIFLASYALYEGDRSKALQLLEDIEQLPLRYLIHSDLLHNASLAIQQGQDFSPMKLFYCFNQTYLADLTQRVLSEIDQGGVFRRRMMSLEKIFQRRFFNYLIRDNVQEQINAGNLKRAFRQLTQLKSCGWASVSTERLRVDICAQLQNSEEALKVLNQIMRKADPMPVDLIAKSRLLRKYNYDKEALELVSKAVERYPAHPEMQLEQAILFEKLGDLKNARTVLDQLRSFSLKDGHLGEADVLEDRLIRQERGESLDDPFRVEIPWEEMENPENPRLSVIISVYDSDRYIEGCLRDVLSQTIAPDLEILVIDSASPGTEREVIESYAERYRNIRYLRTEQRESIYKVWNRGVEMARAPLLTNANTDDRHRADAYEVQVGAFDRFEELGVVYGNYMSSDKDNEVFHTLDGSTAWRTAAYRKEILYKRCLPGPQPVWRRALHDKYRLFREDFRVAGDYEFWIRISEDIMFHRIDSFTGLYLARPDSLEHANEKRARTENEKIVSFHRDKIRTLAKAIKTEPLMEYADVTA
jgi:glycosyltransferase involved in cell wall biosynthesis